MVSPALPVRSFAYFLPRREKVAPVCGHVAIVHGDGRVECPDGGHGEDDDDGLIHSSRMSCRLGDPARLVHRCAACPAERARRTVRCPGWR